MTKCITDGNETNIHTNHNRVIIEMTFLTYAFNLMLHYYYRSYNLFFVNNYSSSQMGILCHFKNCDISEIVIYFIKMIVFHISFVFSYVGVFFVFYVAFINI